MDAINISGHHHTFGMSSARIAALISPPFLHAFINIETRDDKLVRHIHFLHTFDSESGAIGERMRLGGINNVRWAQNENDIG